MKATLTRTATVLLTTLTLTAGTLHPIAERLVMGTSAHASERIRWTPDSDRGRANRTLSGGRRGDATACASSAMSLLVPHDGASLYTVSQHPSFFWHVDLGNSQSATMEFVLTHPNKAEPVYTRTINAAATGLVQIDLPDTVALEPNVRYRWAVMAACANGDQHYARSFIERLEQPGMEQQVSHQAALSQAETYAGQGIWYDAIASLLTAASHHPSAISELHALMQQVNLDTTLVNEQTLDQVSP